MTDFQIYLTLGVFAAVILLIAFDLIDMAVAALLGVCVLIIFDILDGGDLVQIVQTASGPLIVFTVPWSSQYGLRTGSGISQRTDHRGISRSSDLRFDRTNDQGQRIYRGNVAGMADVTLINLSEFVQPLPGGQISVNLDGQWGRGTCANC